MVAQERRDRLRDMLLMRLLALLGAGDEVGRVDRLVAKVSEGRDNAEALRARERIRCRDERKRLGEICVDRVRFEEILSLLSAIVGMSRTRRTFLVPSGLWMVSLGTFPKVIESLSDCQFP